MKCRAHARRRTAVDLRDKQKAKQVDADWLKSYPGGKN
jgi:hypothetical protein